MPIPALIRTYSARANEPLTSTTTLLDMNRSIMFNFKQHLKNTAAGGVTSGSRHANSVWTVVGSSDSVAFGLDGVDRWAAISNLVWASSGTAHSWIVLQNTTIGYQLAIDLNATSTASVGVAATEIGTPFSGGSTTTRPTSTREFTLGTATTGAGNNTALLIDATFGGVGGTHFVADTAGSFWFLYSRTGYGAFHTLIGMQKTSGANAADVRNVFLLGNSTGSARGAGMYNSVSASTFCTGRTHAGVDIHGNLGVLIPYAGGAWIGQIGTGLDVLNGNYMSFPSYVFGINPVVGFAYRGIIDDLYQTSQMPVGSSIPSAAAQTHIVVGDMAIPFPGVQPII